MAGRALCDHAESHPPFLRARRFAPKAAAAVGEFLEITLRTTLARPNDRPIWQRHFWDTQLRRGESYDQKWDYVMQNPVRAGLAECVMIGSIKAN